MKSSHHLVLENLKKWNQRICVEESIVVRIAENNQPLKQSTIKNFDNFQREEDILSRNRGKSNLNYLRINEKKFLKREKESSLLVESDNPMQVTIQFILVQSPRIAVHNKKDSSFDKNPSKKVEEKSGNPLPPKVPRPPPSNQMNYKLPPRPASKQQSGQVPSKNVSYDYGMKKYISERERSIERLNTDRDRQRSKQNLKRVGERAVVQSRGIGRSNSVQRVVYPSWWG